MYVLFFKLSIIICIFPYLIRAKGTVPLDSLVFDKVSLYFVHNKKKLNINSSLIE